MNFDEILRIDRVRLNKLKTRDRSIKGFTEKRVNIFTGKKVQKYISVNMEIIL